MSLLSWRRVGSLLVLASLALSLGRWVQAQQVCPCSIWASTAVPTFMDPEVGGLELGVKFRSDVAGTITAIRFYKYAQNTGPHVGHLWSATGILLGTATFSNETPAGWQQATFATSTPIAIAANTTYVASYHTNSGHYGVTEPGFSTAVDRAPLHALASAASGGNGVYRYTSTTGFPNLSYNASNYWVDVVLVAGALPAPTPDVTPPTVSLSAPPASSVLSGSVMLSATAADNVGVTGVQFKLDGANVGAEDPTSPFSVTWNTATAANGAHALTALARDAAGNTTTSTAVAITVQNLAPNPIASLVVSPTSIVSGQSQAVLTWSTSNATNASINQGIGTVGLNGTTTVSPMTTTTYVLTAQNSSGASTASVTLTVATPSSSPPPPSPLPPPSSAGALTTPMDTIPDPCASPTVTSLQSGRWEDAATWSAGRVPGVGDRVMVARATSVTYGTQSAAAIACVRVDGSLSVLPSVPARLIVGTLIVSATGSMDVGTAGMPVSAVAEIVIADQPLNTTVDPSQYLTGLIVLGQLTMAGAAKTSFVRLAIEPLQNASTLTLVQAPVGWQPGDRLVLPDTRQLHDGEIYAAYAPQYEELTIQSVNGTVVTMTAPLKFSHLGARDGNGHLDFLPHVANLTRSITVRSQNPAGTRGHVLLTYRATVDVRNVAFRDLGRTKDSGLDSYAPGHVGTNQIGRYPVHFHHLMGPSATPPNGYQYTFIGNAIDGGTARHDYKFGITIHDSHYGLVQGNVIYNTAGAALMAEDGSETGNVIDGNFALRVWSNAADRGDARGSEFGYEGAGFWLRGPNNVVRNNVAANILAMGPDAAYGYKLYLKYLGSINVPNFKGADTSVAGQYTTINSHGMTVPEFSNNEVYGATESGLTWWWLGTEFKTPRVVGNIVLKDTTIWHVHNKGTFAYEGHNIVVDGYVVRGKDWQQSACCNTAFFAPDYFNHNLTVQRANIQGTNGGIVPTTATGGGLQTIRDSFIRVAGDAIEDQVLWTSDATPTDVPLRRVDVRNITFAAWPGSTLKSISMVDHGHQAETLTRSDQLFVYDYQGVVGQNFQVFYLQQAPGFVLPAPSSSLESCPTGGLTNAQCWVQYGIAFGGAIASCTDKTTHPEVGGFTCPF